MTTSQHTLELLKALEALVFVSETMTVELDLQSDPTELVNARAAIAKARGLSPSTAA